MGFVLCDTVCIVSYSISFYCKQCNYTIFKHNSLFASKLSRCEEIARIAQHMGQEH